MEGHPAGWPPHTPHLFLYSHNSLDTPVRLHTHAHAHIHTVFFFRWYLEVVIESWFPAAFDLQHSFWRFCCCTVLVFWRIRPKRSAQPMLSPAMPIVNKGRDSSHQWSNKILISFFGTDGLSRLSLWHCDVMIGWLSEVFSCFLEGLKVGQKRISRDLFYLIVEHFG